MPIYLPKTWSFLGLMLLCYSHLFAQIELAPFFSDHMVLQRDRPIRIWGEAPAGEQLRVSMANRVTVVRADENGRWMATMGAVEVGGPYSLEIIGAAVHKELEDVWVGEVWLCMGQSNMEWPLAKTADSEVSIANADLPLLRYFKINSRMAMQPQEHLPSGTWLVSSPENAGAFSGVAFHFAKTKLEKENIPIGIIEASWGATTIKSWLGPNALQQRQDLAMILAQMQNLNISDLQDSLRTAEQHWRESFDEFDIGLTALWQNRMAQEVDWPLMELPQPWERGGPLSADGVVWFKKDFDLTGEQSEQALELSLGVLDDEEEVFVNGIPLASGNFDYRAFRRYTIPSALLQAGENTLTVRISDFGYVGGFIGKPEDIQLIQGDWSLSLAGTWKYRWGTPDLPSKPRPIGPNSYPGLVYNAMIHPLTQLTIGGILWYQGESDLDDPYHYRTLLLNLIDDYRTQWKLGDFPFLIAQLPYFRSPLLQPGESGWATLRESQAFPLQRRSIGLVPLIDQGSTSDIHPRDKAVVGQRFAIVEHLLQDKNPASFGGASVDQIRVEDSTIVLHFKDVGEGIHADSPDQLNGFAVAGENGKYHWADAVLTSTFTIQVSSSLVPHPKFVRYGWADNPGPLQLFDSNLLPVPPFRTDKLKVPWE